MIAPILNKGQHSRDVYLPEDMTEVRWNGNAFSCRSVLAGEQKIHVPLGEVVFYIRRGKCLPVGNSCRNTGEIDLTDVTLLGDGKEYIQYLDDGYTRECDAGNLRILKR